MEVDARSRLADSPESEAQEEGEVPVRLVREAETAVDHSALAKGKGASVRSLPRTAGIEVCSGRSPICNYSLIFSLLRCLQNSVHLSQTLDEMSTE